MQSSEQRVNQQGQLLALHIILFILIGLSLQGAIIWGMVVALHALWYYQLIQRETKAKEKPKSWALTDDGEIVEDEPFYETEEDSRRASR